MNDFLACFIVASAVFQLRDLLTRGVPAREARLVNVLRFVTLAAIAIPMSTPLPQPTVSQLTGITVILIVLTSLALISFVLWLTRRRVVHTFCPECHTEGALRVRINSSGSSPSEYGTNHWFEGDAECCECGWKGPYGDSTH
jgi:hypothetical protein